MLLWGIFIVLAVIFAILLVMVFIRKLQFDVIHQNFLDLEDKIGGQVRRAGFAARPSYACEYKGQNVSISFTSEKNKGDDRRYYITATMEAKAKINFSILSADWMGPAQKNDKRTLIPLQDGEYLMEPRNSTQLHKVKLPSIEAQLEKIAPFAYILMAKTGMILERTSKNITEDMKADSLLKLIDGMISFKKTVE